MTEEKEKYQHERQRKIFWCNAWAAVAGAITCEKPDAATRWDDEALKEFDKRLLQRKNDNEHTNKTQ